MPELTLSPPIEPPPAPRGRRRRASAALRWAAPALLAYAAVRLIGLAILWAAALSAGRSPYHLLTRRWDAVWYARIAERGYGFEVVMPNGDIHSDRAFFPLLPALERGLAEISPLAPADAGLLIGWLSSLAAAWGVFAVGDRLYGRRAGVVLAALWGVAPTAFVQSMAYTESLFTALAAWTLYAVLTGRWVWAGALAVPAGLSRPSGAAVVAALWIPAALILFRAWRARRARSGAAAGTEAAAATAGREGRETATAAVGPGGAAPYGLGRLLLGVALAPLGWVSYVVFVAVATGSPTGYFDVQRQWGNGFDGGLALAGFVVEHLTGPVPLAGVGLCVALALPLWLLVLSARGPRRQPLAPLVYAGVVVLTSLVGSGYFGSRPRLMMPAFPLLLPPALALLGLSVRRIAVIVGVAALASGAYGAFTLLGSGPP
ncbi:hypothetical protein [Streptomyces sp. URMC 123]|uniref:hypothetical protein n=1 Tax=Streptomyces sp. URMC 123 TaxID=3423403 RepID=UPI003F1C0034